MRFLVAFFVLASITYAKNVDPLSDHYPAYGYMKNIGVPLAEKIRQVEEANSRIIGGVPATPGEYPFLASILGDIFIGGSPAMSVCGGSLITPTRVLTAGHCWFDGFTQAWRLTIILGSNQLFTGGIRIQTSDVVLHPNYHITRNDAAIAYLANPVEISDIIAPIALPSRSDLLESFAGETAIAIGVGSTSGGGPVSQTVHHVSVDVIDNGDCTLWYPSIIQSTHLCTTGPNGAGFCQGDSGGPLVINRDKGQILIGVASFLSARGCDSDFPKVYARITSIIDFINQNI